MNMNNPGIYSEHKMKNKIEIKEENLLSDIDLQHEENAFSSEVVKNKNNISVYTDFSGVVTKIENKDEHWWPETTLEEMKYQANASSVSDVQQQYVIKDETVQVYPIAESPRLCTEAAGRVSLTLFTTEELLQNNKLKLKKENVEFVKSNVCEVYESDVTRALCIMQSDHIPKSKSGDHKHNEKINNCSDIGKKLYECEICKKSFNKMRSLEKHILHHSKYPYKGDVYDKNIVVMNKQSFNHEGKDPTYKCDVCEKNFTRLNNLKRHILIHEGKKPYKCDICEMCFTQGSHLKKHILIHEGKRPYKCGLCGKGFTERGGLKSHILIHEGKRPYKCDLCGKCFTERGSLKSHILIHEGKRPYKCNVCEKSFTRADYLNTHILIHKGEKPFKCDVCDKCFTERRSLKRHILIHMGEKPYKCDFCENCFTQRSHLKRHMLIHEGKRPHKCEVCEKRFAVRGSLRKHILIHEGKRPHKCNVCEKRFTERGGLKRHILIHEGKKL